MSDSRATPKSMLSFDPTLHPRQQTYSRNGRSGLVLQILPLFVSLIATLFLVGCRHDDSSATPAAAVASAVTNVPLNLSSSSLQDGRIANKSTCDGEDASPPLAWSAPPAQTSSLVLMVTDPDAPAGTFTHWVLYNLPPSSRELPPNVTSDGQLPDGSRQGRNDFGKSGYGAPCPPRGATHRYFFDLFALDTSLNVPAGATRAQVEDAMNTHVIARGKLVARYTR